jgi:hypothetical protein
MSSAQTERNGGFQRFKRQGLDHLDEKHFGTLRESHWLHVYANVWHCGHSGRFIDRELSLTAPKLIWNDNALCGVWNYG